MAADADMLGVVAVVGSRRTENPSDPAEYRETVQNVMAENYIPSTDAGAGGYPDALSVCQEVRAALSSPHASVEDIGRIISKDRVIAARMLQATNSAYFGLARKITDVVEAVNLLGFQTVASLLADIEALAPAPPRKAGMFLPGLASNLSGQAERKATVPAV